MQEAWGWDCDALELDGWWDGAWWGDGLAGDDDGLRTPNKAVMQHHFTVPALHSPGLHAAGDVCKHLFFALQPESYDTTLSTMNAKSHLAEDGGAEGVSNVVSQVGEGVLAGHLGGHGEACKHSTDTNTSLVSRTKDPDA